MRDEVIEESEVIVMDKLYEESETGCCPRFDPEPWDGKEVTFQEFPSHPAELRESDDKKHGND